MFSAIRRWIAPSSVRGRLTFWYLVTLGVTLVAFAAFAFVVRARSLYRDLDTALEVEALRLEADLHPLLLSLNVADSLAADQRASTVPVLIRAAGTDEVYRSARFPRLSSRGERTAMLAAREGLKFVTVEDRDEAPVRVVTLRVERQGADPVILQLATSALSVRPVLNQLAVTMGIIVLLVLVTASVGSSMTARRALAPVDAIVARAQSLRLGERLDVHADSDEIDRLVRMLNEMLGRIEMSVRGARRFAADVSHELQTPISVMRGAVEMTLRSGRRPEDYRAMASDLLLEIDRLSSLVRDLRTLALAEAGHLNESTDAVDLAALTAECGEIAKALAEERRIDVDIDIRERPVIAGSTSQLRRVILNLAQNAIRYSPDASSVVLGVASRDGQAILTVEDRGCGIEARDLPHIFEPFYRADPARSRDTGGTGLGLAIAEQIVKAHGGRIEVSSVPGHGSTFAVHLPKRARVGPAVG